MEGLVMFSNTYAGRRVLVTGHTGFKGSWLCLWLRRLGARVCGLGLEPGTEPAHYTLCAPDVYSWIADIRDFESVLQVLRWFQPELVLHLAAQSLVRYSYSFPLQTLGSNVLGTAHVLEACRSVDSVRAVLCISSDKCYEHPEQTCREADPLGGTDPYSASKACSELIVSAYRGSYFQPEAFSQRHQTLVASARAGNVIGGGDWGQDRLIPDIMRAVGSGQEARIRNPQAVRPWQHVLEPLSGYLLLGQYLLQGWREMARAWNFGPECGQEVTVAQLVGLLQKSWQEISFDCSRDWDGPPEAALLRLDSSQARQHLGWSMVWDLQSAVHKTVQWYQEYYKHGSLLSQQQLEDYMRQARKLELPWAMDQEG